jgi:hypothetical protein
MEIPNAVLKYGFFTVLGLMIVAIVFAAIKKNSYDRQLANLRNEVAGKAHTIEVFDGVFEKMSLETNDLRATLDAKDKQVQDLLSQVKKNREDLLATNQLLIRWKKAYEGAAAANQTEVPPTGGKVARKRVDFDRSFGAYKVSGFTLTDPAEAGIKLEQIQALAITLAISQDKAGAWHSYVTSSDDNTGVDIKVSAVNPYVLEPRWYELIELNVSLAGGQGGQGFGVLAGVGASYKIKQFNVGPAFFLSISDRVDKFFGLNAAWRPFER